METKKKTKKKSQQPAHVVRDGAIAASIWLRTTQTGFAYYEYSLSRSWISQASGKEGYSNNFFPRNQEAIANVINQASAWIEANNPDEVQTSEAA